MTVRSLTSGVTGMLANQLTMDVSANNIANANTPGFKSSRVSFDTNLVQTLTAGSAPGNNVGGRNPRQVGLGVQAGSIEIDMGQGALQATGRNLDLAIQGEGFFEITDGTRQFYTRVGNMGLDSNNDLVHLGTGFRVIGNTYNLGVNPDGSQNVNEVSVPLNVPVEDAFPPQRTDEITFQGNLSSEDPALRGQTLQSLFQLRDQISGEVASESTRLLNTSTFKPVTPIPPADTSRRIFVYGTQPDGRTYASSFDIHPWAIPTDTNANGSVGELIGKINDALNQGGTRFGSVRIENGNLVATGVGDGDGFSLFVGEGDPTFDLSGASPAVDALADNPIADVIAMPPDTGANNLTGTFNDDAVTGTFASYTVPAAGRGLMEPFFYPDQGSVLDSDVTISIKVNNGEVGVLTIPAGTYNGADVQSRAFRLPSLPHLDTGDVVQFDLVNGDVAGPSQVINYQSFLVPDNDPDNLTSDIFGGNANGIPDMFEENSTTDPNAWTYENGTNSTFNWHRMRLVPDFVSTSIEVFDAQGGSHILEARLFRAGTRTEAGTGARINSWDLVVGIAAGDGELIDDVVAGIEFDQEGRFTGSVGTSPHGTPMNETDYVGNPTIPSVQIDWAATGPTDPANIRLNLGEPSTFNGLTGFGSESNGSMVDQNGFSDGLLDNISVSTEGDLIALYTNGVSRKLAQITMSTFRNPEGLVAVEGNLWQQSTNSGNPTRRVPGQNAGFISAGALEGSNVDIATEFSRMIVAQRGFQTNARVIQTTDEMLEELANLLR